MLLTVHNLPPDIDYPHIKRIIQELCFANVLLINLQKVDDGSSKVTVSAAHASEAAAILKTLNGLEIESYKLKVELGQDSYKLRYSSPSYEEKRRLSTKFNEYMRQIEPLEAPSPPRISSPQIYFRKNNISPDFSHKPRSHSKSPLRRRKSRSISRYRFHRSRSRSLDYYNSRRFRRSRSRSKSNCKFVKRAKHAKRYRRSRSRHGRSKTPGNRRRRSRTNSRSPMAKRRRYRSKSRHRDKRSHSNKSVSRSPPKILRKSHGRLSRKSPSELCEDIYKDLSPCNNDTIQITARNETEISPNSDNAVPAAHKGREGGIESSNNVKESRIHIEVNQTRIVTEETNCPPKFDKDIRDDFERNTETILNTIMNKTSVSDKVANSTYSYVKGAVHEKKHQTETRQSNKEIIKNNNSEIVIKNNEDTNSSTEITPFNRNSCNSNVMYDNRVVNAYDLNYPIDRNMTNSHRDTNVNSVERFKNNNEVKRVSFNPKHNETSTPPNVIITSNVLYTDKIIKDNKRGYTNYAHRNNFTTLPLDGNIVQHNIMNAFDSQPNNVKRQNVPILNAFEDKYETDIHIPYNQMVPNMNIPKNFNYENNEFLFEKDFNSHTYNQYNTHPRQSIVPFNGYIGPPQNAITFGSPSRFLPSTKARNFNVGNIRARNYIPPMRAGPPSLMDIEFNNNVKDFGQHHDQFINCPTNYLARRQNNLSIPLNNIRQGKELISFKGPSLSEAQLRDLKLLDNIKLLCEINKRNVLEGKPPATIEELMLSESDIGHKKCNDYVNQQQIDINTGVNDAKVLQPMDQEKYLKNILPKTLDDFRRKHLNLTNLCSKNPLPLNKASHKNPVNKNVQNVELPIIGGKKTNIVPNIEVDANTEVTHTSLSKSVGVEVNIRNGEKKADNPKLENQATITQDQADIKRTTKNMPFSEGKQEKELIKFKAWKANQSNFAVCKRNSSEVDMKYLLVLKQASRKLRDIVIQATKTIKNPTRNEYNILAVYVRDKLHKIIIDKGNTDPNEEEYVDLFLNEHKVETHREFIETYYKWCSGVFYLNEDDWNEMPEGRNETVSKKGKNKKKKSKRSGKPRNGGARIGNIRLPAYKRPRKDFTNTTELTEESLDIADNVDLLNTETPNQQNKDTINSAVETEIIEHDNLEQIRNFDSVNELITAESRTTLNTETSSTQSSEETKQLAIQEIVNNDYSNKAEFLALYKPNHQEVSFNNEKPVEHDIIVSNVKDKDVVEEHMVTEKVNITEINSFINEMNTNIATSETPKKTLSSEEIKQKERIKFNAWKANQSNFGVCYINSTADDKNYLLVLKQASWKIRDIVIQATKTIKHSTLNEYNILREYIKDKLHKIIKDKGNIEPNEEEYINLFLNEHKVESHREFIETYYKWCSKVFYLNEDDMDEMPEGRNETVPQIKKGKRRGRPRLRGTKIGNMRLPRYKKPLKDFTNNAELTEESLNIADSTDLLNTETSNQQNLTTNKEAINSAIETEIKGYHEDEQVIENSNLEQIQNSDSVNAEFRRNINTETFGPHSSKETKQLAIQKIVNNGYTNQAESLILNHEASNESSRLDPPNTVNRIEAERLSKENHETSQLDTSETKTSHKVNDLNKRCITDRLVFADDSMNSDQMSDIEVKKEIDEEEIDQIDAIEHPEWPVKIETEDYVETYYELQVSDSIQMPKPIAE